jgi:hypothetical protein
VVGDLIMLPVRVGVRATQLWLRAAEGTVSVAANATSRLVGLAAARSSGGNGETATLRRPDTARPDQFEAARFDAAPPPRRRPETERENGAIAREAAAAMETEAVAAPEPPPAEPAPAHVSEEPALVEEIAEPGAEDGAGAEIHINEPWEGYARMTAKEIIGRLGAATPAEMAAVQLYESSQRQRQTILNAVQRELRRANGRGG